MPGKKTLHHSEILPKIRVPFPKNRGRTQVMILRSKNLGRHPRKVFAMASQRSFLLSSMLEFLRRPDLWGCFLPVPPQALLALDHRYTGLRLAVGSHYWGCKAERPAPSLPTAHSQAVLYFDDRRDSQ